MLKCGSTTKSSHFQSVDCFLTILHIKVILLIILGEVVCVFVSVGPFGSVCSVTQTKPVRGISFSMLVLFCELEDPPIKFRSTV